MHRTHPLRGGRAAPAVLAAALLAALAFPAAAQQFETDDASIVDAGACQLEAWHGRTESWILPACHPFGGVEVTAGVGWTAGAGRRPGYLLQGKSVVLQAPRSGLAAGLAAGLVAGGDADAEGGRLAGVYAYVPASLPLADSVAFLHANVGWGAARDPHTGARGLPHRAAFWGFAGEVAVGSRLSIMAEVFGETGEAAGYQAGVHVPIVADRFTMDLTWGGPRGRGAGWVVGAAWTLGPASAEQRKVQGERR